MNPSQLLTHFDRIAEAPRAIPRLRRLIVELAVRGKLVAPAASDGPASALLNQIQAEKARLIKLGTIKQQATPASVNREDVPFAVPNHWEWVRLSEVGILSGGMTPAKNRREFWDGDLNWFSPKDIKSDDVLSSELKITSVGASETGLQVYPPGCLFMVARSGILKRTFPIAINRVEGTVNQDLKVLKPFVLGLERYLQIMFQGMTDFVLSTLVKTGTTVQSLKYEEFATQPIPLPPLREQHRIAAKVAEITALCNRLEATQVERDSHLRQLLEAVLDRAVTPTG